MSGPFHYPGDDVMGKALGEAFKHARLEAGLSIGRKLKNAYE